MKQFYVFLILPFFFIPFQYILAQKELLPDIFYIPYENETTALLNAQSKSEWVMSLNSWKCYKGSTINDIEQSFFKKEFDDSNWQLVKLPDTSKSTYKKIIFYRKLFPIPEIFYGREIFLHVDDTLDLFSIWINGRQINKNSHKTSKIVNITAFVKFGGMNLLNIVYKNDKNQTLGLCNTIVLYSLSPVYVKNYSFSNTKINSKEVSIDGSINIVNSHIEEKTKVDIGIALYTSTGKIIFQDNSIENFSIKNNTIKDCRIKLSIKNDSIFEINQDLKILLILKDKVGNKLIIPSTFKY